MPTKLNGLVLLGSVVFSLTSTAQNITPISGFHASSETDPFAPKNVLEVTSAPTPVAGLNGVRATVTVSCREGNPVAAFAIKVLGGSLGAALGFSISIVGGD